MARTDTLDKINLLENQVDMGVAGELVPVHISPDEIIYFNIMQGGQSVDQETGLREYTKLGLVLQKPEVLKLLMNVLDIQESDKEVPEDIKQVLDTPTELELEGFEPIESDSNPEIHQMAETGEGHDKFLVMMPQSVVNLLDEIQGGELRDPTLGLQEFGFFSGIGKMVGKVFDPVSRITGGMLDKVSPKLGNAFRSLVRVGTTVAGTMVGGFFGGPAGAAAGAYAGNMAGRMSTGQKLGGSNPAWRAAAPNALYGGLGYLGAGYLAGAGGAAGAGAGGAGASGAGAGAGAAPIFNGAVSSAPGMTTAATPYISGAAAGTGSGLGAAAGAAAPSMLSTYGLPAALIGGGMLMNKKGEKQREAENERHYQDDKERRDEVNRRALGKYDTPYTISPRHNSFNPNEYSRINYDEPRNYYKKGGKVVGVEIVGRGTGQSDHIPRTVPENSWVWDATTVAHSGDGTTNAGQKAIEKFEKMIHKHKLPEVKHEIDISIKKQPLRKVPCALSNGERVTPPHLVAAVGDGSFDKGAKVLRKMTKELRRHKASKGLDLPPAAHDLTVYYKKALRGV